MADAFLVHNRTVVTRCDDSIACSGPGGLQLIQRSRGYAPKAVKLPQNGPPVLAVGGPVKNAVCVTRGSEAFLSQHIGELATPAAFGAFDETIRHLLKMLEVAPSLIAHDGEAKTEEWAKGVVANFARAPKGGDTDQIKSVAAGECGVAVSNTYYLARLIRSDKVEDRRLMERVGIVWPNQANRGTHINISGAGMVKTAKNPEAAVKFLEYLASDEAQRYFADGNNEWPVVTGVATNNPALEAMGKFKADNLPIGNLARNVAAAQKLLDRAGYR